MSEAFIKLDFRCNQECLFCCTSDDKDSLSAEEARNLIAKYVNDMGYRTVCFTGGEPTLRPDLPELVSYAKSLSAEVKLQTNGSLLYDKKIASQLVDAGVTRALVSIHSHKDEINDFITNTPGSLQKSLSGIQNLLELGVDIHLAYVITNQNIELTDFVRFVKSRFPVINFFLFFLPYPLARGWRNRQYVPRLGDIEKNLSELYGYCKSKGIGFSTRGIPLCYMAGFENHSSETQALMSEEKPMVINDYEVLEPKHSFEETNVKDDCCKFCAVNDCCGGVWRYYPDIHKHQLWPVVR
ncbi:MAG: radical SAM protein [Candidatus Woesearchaeota archaeon]